MATNDQFDRLDRLFADALNTRATWVDQAMQSMPTLEQTESAKNLVKSLVADSALPLPREVVLVANQGDRVQLFYASGFLTQLDHASNWELYYKPTGGLEAQLMKLILPAQMSIVRDRVNPQV
jgi:hypothetical protein